MAHPTTQHRPGLPSSSPAARPARTTATGSPARGLASMAAGGASVVVAILPSLGLVALVLAGAALAVGVPVLRCGPRTAAFPFARSGVVLGMIGVLLGFVSLAMQLFG